MGKTIIKTNLHPRNKHRSGYDFAKLVKSHIDLSRFVRVNDYGDESIDFSDPKAVLALNTALLKYFYNIEYWKIPDNYLCPPVPGRADYIHYIADLLIKSKAHRGKTKNQIKCLDIGVGANCIYPIIGVSEYGWSFVGTDIDVRAIESAKEIVNMNPILNGMVKLKLQRDSGSVFKGVIKRNDYFDLVICNPPFHSSPEEAKAGSIRKVSNLKGKRLSNPTLNFGGVSSELWCEGGEKQFIRNMIFESRIFAKNVNWFTSLISKKSNLSSIFNALKKVKAREVHTIQMGQGNKISRIVAWRI